MKSESHAPREVRGHSGGAAGRSSAPSARADDDASRDRCGPAVAADFAGRV